MKMGNIYNDNNGDDNDRQGTNLDQKSSHEPTVLLCKYGLSFKKITKEKGAHLHVYDYMKGHQHSSSYKCTSLQSRWNFRKKVSKGSLCLLFRFQTE